jgi:hypothetical protein
MTLTLQQLKLAEPSLNKLLTAELPVTVSFRLSRMIKKLAEELVFFEDSRKKLVEKYGVTDSEGKTTVTPENQAIFIDEINQLLSVTVELPDVKITVEDLRDVKISAVEIASLEPWIQDSEN